MSRPIRWSAIVLVLACLTAGTAQAWPLEQALPRFPTLSVESRVMAAWEWLASQIRREEPKPASQIRQPQRKGGCTRDPNGHPVNCV